ncbi:MAG: D-alanyl-D-alaninecarboxypeptidase/D-alanyl-D-alanine-endopeptidase [Segetibacter sp.]|nr:D-alanyl-D-alaninecarboxypeptidase/D-alanyl-D-alanine-endopeptidase [Segetibacter sp.]
MKTFYLLISLTLSSLFIKAQGISSRLGEAVKSLETDAQMKNAIIGFYVINNKTGDVVYDRNGNVGLAAASTQKIITSATALELLGTTYRYKTEFGYDGVIESSTLNGNVYIIGSGDPTFGSWRYDRTKEQVVLDNFTKAIQQAGIKKLNGAVVGYDKKFETQTIPGGWIWDDIGNYYGAGISGLNWRENQYDLKLKSGNSTGDKVTIAAMEPKVSGVELTNELLTGKAGSGDNAYIYLPPYSTTGFVRGTIPPNQNSFTISGSVPDPTLFTAQTFAKEVEKRKLGSNLKTASFRKMKNEELPKYKTLYTHYSPGLDSIVYWFLKKSINLYGEALVKTLGSEIKNTGSTEVGIDVIKDFWKTKGIDPSAIKMLDGSGLSPQNRLAPEALVKVMQYAKSRPWFNVFNEGLPEYNGLKMKSGTIGGAKSFTGYSGDYTFAIIINNYIGSSSDVVKKMYKVLNVLK